MKPIKKCAVLALCGIMTVASVGLAACDKSIDYAHPDRVSVYETTGTKSALMSRKTSVGFVKFDEEDYTRQTVYVDTSALYQEYVGYGASMTHASAHLLCEADDDTRADILHDLYSRDGANFSVVRIPVGASDYIDGTEYFTCDDLPSGQTDKALEHFNLDRDGEIISVLQEIIEIDPSVKFMASPWSAPAWMKENESLVGGGGLKSDMYEAYADYLVKFVEEYGKLGINISMITLLNEPSVGALSYPTMDMTAVEAARLTELTGDRLSAKGLNVDIVSWDFNYGSSSGAFADTYFEQIYEEYADTAGKYSHTVGFHGYDGDGYFNPDMMYGMKDGIEKASKEYGKKSLITEITESAAGTDFASNLTYACKNIVVNPCAVQTDVDDNAWNGAGGALYWNYVLTSDGQPTPAYHGNECYGVISLDKVTRQGETVYKYSKSSAYYAMAQVSKFLYDVDGKPCYGLKATTEYVDLNVMSYYRNDGAIVVVVCNTNETNDAPLDVVIDGRKISYDMRPQSIVTFVC